MCPSLHVPISPCPHLSMCPSLHVPISPLPISHVPISPSLHVPISPSLHVPISPSLHVPISPSLHVPISPSLHVPISPSLHVPISHLSMCPSLHLSMCPSLHLSMCPSLHVPISPCAHLSMCPSLHVPISPSSPQCWMKTSLRISQGDHSATPPGPITSQKSPTPKCNRETHHLRSPGPWQRHSHPRLDHPHITHRENHSRGVCGPETPSTSTSLPGGPCTSHPSLGLPRGNPLHSHITLPPTGPPHSALLWQKGSPPAPPHKQSLSPLHSHHSPPCPPLTSPQGGPSDLTSLLPPAPHITLPPVHSHHSPPLHLTSLLWHPCTSASTLTPLADLHHSRGQRIILSPPCPAVTLLSHVWQKRPLHPPITQSPRCTSQSEDYCPPEHLSHHSDLPCTSHQGSPHPAQSHHSPPCTHITLALPPAPSLHFTLPPPMHLTHSQPPCTSLTNSPSLRQPRAALHHSTLLSPGGGGTLPLTSRAKTSAHLHAPIKRPRHIHHPHHPPPGPTASTSQSPPNTPPLGGPPPHQPKPSPTPAAPNPPSESSSITPQTPPHLHSPPLTPFPSSSRLGETPAPSPSNHTPPGPLHLWRCT
ncbi:hypothetical protein FKM82_016629 [Ascaphus truei]